MDSNQPMGQSFSFTPEQIRRVLGTKEGQHPSGILPQFQH